MKDSRDKRARAIMQQIHDVLWNDWDPIGTHDFGPDDEYDSYIGGVYRILSETPSEVALVEHLSKIESEAMGTSLPDKNLLRVVAKKLLEIDVTLEKA